MAMLRECCENVGALVIDRTNTVAYSTGGLEGPGTLWVALQESSFSSGRCRQSRQRPLENGDSGILPLLKLHDIAVNRKVNHVFVETRIAAASDCADLGECYMSCAGGCNPQSRSFSAR